MIGVLALVTILHKANNQKSKYFLKMLKKTTPKVISAQAPEIMKSKKILFYANPFTLLFSFELT